ncbi:hypothetical protein CP02DC14_0931 [Chlamydia psittaci 02DC14]|nr:hypothetical protein CP02DC14_0931 [Chlamydia psittaci 02DC14]
MIETTLLGGSFLTTTSGSFGGGGGSLITVSGSSTTEGGVGSTTSGSDSRGEATSSITGGENAVESASTETGEGMVESSDAKDERFLARILRGEVSVDTCSAIVGTLESTTLFFFTTFSLATFSVTLVVGFSEELFVSEDPA